MSEKGLPRPSQVTVAGGMGVAGALIFVVALFDAMSATRSVDARDAVADLLARPPWEGTGVTVDEMLQFIRYALFGMGAVAAVAFVLAIYVFQRNNAARIGFTVAAVLALPGLTGTVGLGFASILMATAAISLWSEPARDWFAGRAPAARTQRPAASPPVSSKTAAPLTSQEQPPPSAYPFGSPMPPEGREQPQPPPQYPPPHEQHPQEYPPQYPQQYPQPYPQPHPQPYGGPGYPGYPPPADPDRRPGSVVWAAVLTWITAGLTALLMGLALVLLVGNQDDFERRIQEEINADPQLRDLNMATDQLVTYVWVVCVLVVVWSLAAIALAALAFRRVVWARIMLAVSAGIAALLSLIGILSVVSVIPLGASVATIILLFTRSANAWYSRRPPAPPTTYYPPPPHGRSQPW